ncbi:dentin sialophosphoprotein-like [Physella acuta]|uniref:dentin sialophosphoprotein-like n=1 Tax=Physella acuta TaxID=109671 RepID=UPI0027DDD608|nr:dentin sialophosphoprotein-like [Physella acuta]
MASLHCTITYPPCIINTQKMLQVTMDTTEGEPVATDGGEAMADDEGDDTNTSSSSSSSEELIPSDGNESAGVSSDDSRPWASITKDLEDKKENPEIVPTINDSPSTSATQPTDTSDSSKETEQNLPESENSEHLSDSSQSSLNHSFGFLAAAENPPSSSTDSKLDIKSDGADSSHTDSAIDTTPSESEKVRTYAEVVSTSNSSHSPQVASTEECDSVAGLERLVESVEPESSTQHQPSPSLTPSTHQSSEADHSDTSDFDEPRAKRMKLSHESVTSHEPDTTDVLQSDMASSSPVHPSSKPSSSPSPSSEMNSVVTPESSEVIEEETRVTSGSDSNSSIVPNSDNVMETVSSGSEETESLTPAMATPEIPGSDNVSNDDENVTSPPSHLSSSSDSQGFDVCGDSLSKYNADSKQTAAECADKKDEESGTDSPKQESMDQD